MPDLTYVVYDNATFFEDERIPLLKKDTPPRFESLTDIVTPILKNADDIINLKKSLQDTDELLIDNQARINNLEDAEVEKIKAFLYRASIRKDFENATQVEIEYGRKDIVSLIVCQILVNTPTYYEEKILTGVLMKKIITVVNGVTTRKVVLDFGNIPITGYVNIL